MDRAGTHGRVTVSSWPWPGQQKNPRPSNGGAWRRRVGKVLWEASVSSWATAPSSSVDGRSGSSGLRCETRQKRLRSAATCRRFGSSQRAVNQRKAATSRRTPRRFSHPEPEESN